MVFEIDKLNAEKAKWHQEKAALILALRRAGVTEESVLNAIEHTPRHVFIPAAFRDHTYHNSALPIGCGQTISQPTIVGIMTQALKTNKRKLVLEIGTGSGYQTMILSLLSRRVYTIERVRELSLHAQEIFRQFECHNIVPKIADGGLGWPEVAPFERIIVTAAAEDFPPILMDQLAPDGIMIIPIGHENDKQTLFRVINNAGRFDISALADVRFVPMLSGTVLENIQANS